MYGTIFRMRPKAGKSADIIALLDEESASRPAIKGMLKSYMLTRSDTEIWGAAVFADEATYRANASSSEQDRWYRRLRDMLEADPEWNDGEIHEYGG